jgi:hypothetical protein
MIKVIAAVRRRPTMTRAEYLRYIEEVHGGLSKANPMGLARYVQNHVFDGAFGKAAYAHWFHRDSVTELYFPGGKELVETFTHPYTREVIAPDGAKFADLDTNLTLPPVVEEILEPPPGPGRGVKIMHFLKAADTASFEARWPQAHVAAIAAAPDFASRLEGYTRNIARPPAEGQSAGGAAHFGGGDMPKFDGVGSFWLGGEADQPTFRAYEAALAGAGLYDPDMSFFLYAREVEIFDVSAKG